MKKNNGLFITLFFVFSFFISTNGFSQNSGTIMDKEVEEYKDFEDILQSIAIIYGVHGQLSKQEGIHIDEFDDIIAKIKRYLENNGMNFAELAGSPDFILTVGRARICSYFLYPEIESIFKVKLPKQKRLDLDAYCNKLSFAEAIKTIKKFIE